jgi:hypothetical protein
MAVAHYTYMIHDLLTNAPLGELPLAGVRHGHRLNDSGAFTGTFDLDSKTSTRRRVKDPYDWTMPVTRCIYAYRDERPVWGGIIWTRRYDSNTRKVQIGATDWWSYFDHRHVIPVLPARPPVNHVARQQVRYDNVDQNEIARRLVRLAQSHTGGNIDVQLDGSLSEILRDRTYAGYELTSLGEALRNLANVLDGPDMTFGVASTLDQRGRPIRQLRIGEPYLGQRGSAHVWEYPGNCTSYVWPSDGTRYASRRFATGDGAAEGMPIAVAEDRDRYRAGWPLAEAEQGYSGVTDPSTLQDHADADQFAARLPVVLPTLTVRGDMHPTVGEWSLGDDALVAIDDDFMVRGVSTPMRIVADEIAPGEDAETVTLTMAPLLDDVA